MFNTSELDELFRILISIKGFKLRQPQWSNTTLSSAKLDACGQRWVAKLANYNFTIKYKCGLSNVEADALSRISWPEILADTEDLNVDLNCMDTHVVNAILAGSRSKFD